MMATRLDSKKSVYGWMDEEQYEDLWCHVTKNCFCNEFITVEGQACPDIELVCWRHDKMDKKCDACVLVDYLNPMDISLWRTSLPRLKCNMLRCPHKWVAHSCAECECVCNSEFPPEYREITEYQEIPMFDDDSLDAVPEDNTDKVPFAADILKDCLHGLELIYPKDYEVDEYLYDSVRPNTRTPLMKPHSQLNGPLIWSGTCGAPFTERPTDHLPGKCLRTGPLNPQALGNVSHRPCSVAPMKPCRDTAL